jgi:hypothetical protein
LSRQFSDSVCDVFLWQRGIFYFEADEPPAEEIPPLPIDTVALVMEGTRWIDELARIRQILVHDNVVLRHGPKYRREERLTPYESRVGATVDGRSNLAELYGIVRGSYFRFLDTAYRLCLREVLDIFKVGEHYEPSDTDLKLSEVVLERTRERSLEVPITALGRLYPVLTVLPDPAELERHPAPLVDFLTGLDGGTPLEDLLAADRDRAEQQLEALLVELRQGRLALLPAPPDRLDELADQRGEPSTGRWWQRLLPQRR